MGSLTVFENKDGVIVGGHLNWPDNRKPEALTPGQVAAVKRAYVGIEVVVERVECAS